MGYGALRHLHKIRDPRGSQTQTFTKGGKRASGRQRRAEEAPGLGGETLGLVSASDLTGSFLICGMHTSLTRWW